MFRKKNKSKEAPLPKTSSGSAYYLSRREINGLMETQPVQGELKPRSLESSGAFGQPVVDGAPFVITSGGLQLRPADSHATAATQIAEPQSRVLVLPREMDLVSGGQLPAAGKGEGGLSQQGGPVSLDTSDTLRQDVEESRTEKRAMLSVPVEAGYSRQKMDQLISLRRNAEGLCTKLHALIRLCALGSTDPAGGGRMASPRGGTQTVDSFLFGAAGIIPEQPKLKVALIKKFPEHPKNLNLDKVDRPGVDAIARAAWPLQQRLEPWCQVLADTMTFTEHSLRLLNDSTKTLITFSTESNALVMDAFMDLFVAVIRVNMLADRVPKKCLLQLHALAAHHSSHSSKFPVDPKGFDFVVKYEHPVPALQRDFETISPRIGEVFDAMAPQVLSLLNMETIRQDGVLSPWPLESHGTPINPLPAQAQYAVSPAIRQEALSSLRNTPVDSRTPGELAENRALEFSAIQAAIERSEKGTPQREAPDREMEQLALEETASLESGSWANSPFTGDPYLQNADPNLQSTDPNLQSANPNLQSAEKSSARPHKQLTPQRARSESVTPNARAEGMDSEGPEVSSASKAWPNEEVDLSPIVRPISRPDFEPHEGSLQPQGLRALESHLQWVLFGFLACPTELAKGDGLRTRLVEAVLGQVLVLPLFRSECIHIHEEYAQFVLPRLAEVERQAKSQKGDQEEALRAAKAARKAIKNAADFAPSICAQLHQQRRLGLHHELERMVLAFKDVPGMLPKKIQNIFGALSLARAELHRHFHHLGVPAKSKGGKAPISEDAADATVGSLLHIMQQLAALVKDYRTAVRSHAAAKLLEARTKVHFFSGLAVAGLDLDENLKQLLTSLASALDEGYLREIVKGGPTSGKLQAFQQTWKAALSLLSSTQSSVNLRHLELATSQGMVPGLARECNIAYQLARCVDELDVLLEESSSLKVLHFYQPKLLLVLQRTLYDLLGFPEDACSWLRLADSFAQNAHSAVPLELPQLAVSAIEYTEKVLEFLMSGLQSMVAALDSKSGWAALDGQISAERAVLQVQQSAQSKAGKRRASAKRDELPLSQVQPGSESDPSAAESIQSVENAVQRLTSFVAELGCMGPVKVLDRVYAPREYLRERLHDLIKARLQDNYLAGLKAFRPPQLLEEDLRRFEAILQLIGRHVSIDVTRVLREVLLSEAYTGRMRDLQPQASKTAAAAEGPQAVAAVIADWYIDFVVADLRNAGVAYSQSSAGFTSLNHSTANVEQVTRVEAFQSLLRVFGPYGADRLVAKALDITTAATTSLEALLRSNQAALQELQANFHSPEKRARLLPKLKGIEHAYALTTQVGQCIALRESVADACATVMKQHVPLIHTVLGDAVRCLPPPNLPEGVNVGKLRRVAHKVGAGEVESDLPDPFVYNALLALGKVGDAGWRLLPVLWAACIGTSYWKAAHFDARAQAFSNNAHCFAKGLQTLLACSERVGSERRELQYQLESAQIKMLTSEGGDVREPTENDEASDVSTGSPLSEVVRSQMGKYLTYTVALTLADWDGHGAPAQIRPVMTKLIFLDQLCEMSPHLSRSTLEQHVPHTLLRSIYQAEYTLQALPVNMQHPAAIPGARSSLSMTSRAS